MKLDKKDIDGITKAMEESVIGIDDTFDTLNDTTIQLTTVFTKDLKEITPLEVDRVFEASGIVFANYVKTNVLNALVANIQLYSNDNELNSHLIKQFIISFNEEFAINICDVRNYGTYITDFTIASIAASMASTLPPLVQNYSEIEKITTGFHLSLVLLFNRLLHEITDTYGSNVVKLVDGKAILRYDDIVEIKQTPEY